MWLLSISALRLLFERCGWSDKRGLFATRDGNAEHLDLYTEIGSALGSRARPSPELRRLGWSALSASVIPLEDARFYHLGSSRQLFESFEQIQRGRLSPRRALCAATPASMFSSPSSLPVWLDAVAGRGAIRLEGHNIVAGLPPKSAVTGLGQGWCVESAPIGRTDWVLRPHHLDDTLRGATGRGATICGQDADDWLAKRGLAHLKGDVFSLPIYPVLTAREIDQKAVSWFFDPHPDPAVGERLGRHRRLSAAQIPGAVDFARYFSIRRAAHAGCLRAEFEACLFGADMGIFTQDFAAISRLC